MACRYQRNANTLYNNEQFIYACTWTYIVAYCKTIYVRQLEHKCISTST